jgi:hypothetical protein
MVNKFYLVTIFIVSTMATAFHLTKPSILGQRVKFISPPLQMLQESGSDSKPPECSEPKQLKILKHVPKSVAILLNPTDFVKDPAADLPSPYDIFLTQASLLAFVLVFELITGFKFTHGNGFNVVGNVQTFITALTLSLPLIGLSYFNEKYPQAAWNFPQQVSRSTKLFSLRLLGKDTKPLTAAVTALILSFCAGLCEEVFFRGFLLSFLESLSNFPVAMICEAFLIYNTF